VKPTPEEQRILDAMIDWYVGEAIPMFKESERNAAFLQATSAAMEGLNKETERRFTMAFSAMLRADPGRYKALHSALSQAIHARLGSGPGASVKVVEPSPGEHTLRNYLTAMTACFEAARLERLPSAHGTRAAAEVAGRVDRHPHEVDRRDGRWRRAPAVHPGDPSPYRDSWVGGDSGRAS
jgi:hypothetical protein